MDFTSTSTAQVLLSSRAGVRLLCAVLLRQPARVPPQTLHPGNSQPKAIRKESEGLRLRFSHQPARLYCLPRLCKDCRSP